MKTIILIFIIGLVLSAPAQGIIKTENVVYQHQGTTLQGTIAWDDGSQTKRPGILIIHDWDGLGEYEKSRAQQVAALGYVAFALDMYGQGIRPANPKASAKESSKYKNDRALMRARAQAGLEQLRRHPLVANQELAVMGYCFGGTTSLELARSGAAIKGAISFHGHLDTPDPQDAKNIKGKILVLHGADDPYVPQKQIVAFEQEMRAAEVDWQLVQYGHAVHSFTNTAAGQDNSKGSAYNQLADQRSWQAMQLFFNELFNQ